MTNEAERAALDNWLDRFEALGCRVGFSRKQGLVVWHIPDAVEDRAFTLLLELTTEQRREAARRSLGADVLGAHDVAA